MKLYHGTSLACAEAIQKDGFKDRVGAGVSNWGEKSGQEGFIYLTRAYPFYYGQAASGEDKMAAVLQVEVDQNEFYPDEDFLTYVGLDDPQNIEKYKHLGWESYQRLGNVAVKPEAIKAILGRKDFSVLEMFRFSDPSMSPMNYQILGEYYRQLTDKWWAGEPYEHLKTYDFLGNLSPTDL